MTLLVVALLLARFVVISSLGRIEPQFYGRNAVPSRRTCRPQKPAKRQPVPSTPADP
jgi:hypothetical protein